MASRNRRYRSSTSASNSTSSNSKSYDILRGLLDGLSEHVDSSESNGYPETPPLIKDLRAIAQHVATPASKSHQDDFRHASGFESVLAVLRRFSGFYDPTRRTEAELLFLFRLLGASLSVFSAAFRGHSGNRRFFRFRVEGGGWEALEQVIASIGLGGAEPDPWVSCHVFGKLLSFALDDEALDLLCHSTAKALRPEVEGTSQNQEDDGVEEQWDLVLARSIENIGPTVREVVNSKSIIRYPEILRAVISFWTSIPRTSHTPMSPGSVIVLETILCAASASIHNRAAIHSTGVLSPLLRVAFNENSTLAGPEREKILAICKLLMFLGVNEPADTQFYFRLQAPRRRNFAWI